LLCVSHRDRARLHPARASIARLRRTPTSPPRLGSAERRNATPRARDL